MRTPREYFDAIVKPAVDDWEVQPQREHRALAAVHFLNTMAEHVYLYWEGRDSSKVAGLSGRKPPDVREYRKVLAKQHWTFQVVWDLDDGQKHVELQTASRLKELAMQTRGYGQGHYSSGAFDSPGFVVIAPNAPEEDRAVGLLCDFVADVMATWDRLTAP